MKYIFFLLTLTLFFACSADHSADIPESVMPKEKMVKVMLDVHLQEASMNLSAFNPQKVPSGTSVAVLNEDILKKHNITKQQFDESFDFYTKNPKLLSEVYQEVLNELSKMQAEVMNEK